MGYHDGDPIPFAEPGDFEPEDGEEKMTLNKLSEIVWAITGVWALLCSMIFSGTAIAILVAIAIELYSRMGD